MKKSIKNYIMPISTLILMGTVLILSTIMFFNNSLAWVASNDHIDAGGMSVSVRGLPDADVYLMVDGVSIDENATDIFADLLPGQKVSFNVCVKNNTDDKIFFRISIAAPTAEQDTPYVVDGLYHYFGSQIRINSIKNGSDDLLTLSGSYCYLLPLSDNLYANGLPPTAIDSEYDFSLLEERNLTSEVEINAGGQVTLDVELEFVDNNTLQNAYIDFGKVDGQTLSRTLLCYLFYDK